MPDDQHPFHLLNLNFEANHFSHGMFLARAFAAGHAHFRTSQWRTSAQDLGTPAVTADASSATDTSRALITEVGECLAHVILNEGAVHIHLAGENASAADSSLARLRKAYPPVKASLDGPTLPVSFWSVDRYGNAVRRGRDLDMPAWKDLRANYAGCVRDALENLMAQGPPTTAEGKVILWHGLPGTGKTFALRALGRAWRSWCDVGVVTDPERLLGDTNDYLLDVLSPDDGEQDPDRWQLLVLEDTGELLAADARERTGQGLARFLNVVDGLLGQSLKTMFLVTTNEEIGRLHPAVSRPGRCLAQVSFEPLATDEANAWLAHRCEERVNAPTSLADLYALAAGRELEKPRLVGFELPESEAA